ncbi:hypothetical protein BJV77DRAFT_967484 [Russula vinacea]|nr:hypothetical protein BJV77DRAFT_967484 [Russula vinacea]
MHSRFPEGHLKAQGIVIKECIDKIKKLWQNDQQPAFDRDIVVMYVYRYLTTKAKQPLKKPSFWEKTDYSYKDIVMDFHQWRLTRRLLSYAVTRLDQTVTLAAIKWPTTADAKKWSTQLPPPLVQRCHDYSGSHNGANFQDHIKGTRRTDQGTDGLLPALDETMKKPLVYRKTLIGSYMTAMYGEKLAKFPSVSRKSISCMRSKQASVPADNEPGEGDNGDGSAEVVRPDQGQADAPRSPHNIWAKSAAGEQAGESLIDQRASDADPGLDLEPQSAAGEQAGEGPIDQASDIARVKITATQLLMPPQASVRHLIDKQMRHAPGLGTQGGLYAQQNGQMQPCQELVYPLKDRASH